MSPQHDLDLANNSGAAFRADLNLALEALQTNSSGATEIADVDSKPYQFWADTDSSIMKMRNGADNAWVSLFNLDGSSLGPGKVTFGATEVVFNDAGNDVDFRIEGDNEANLFFVDAGNDRVGIADSGPDFDLDVNGDIGIREDNNLTFHDGTGTAAFRIRGTSDNKLFFERASGNEHQMVIDDGKVGIGTTSPTYGLLDVRTTLASTSYGADVARFNNVDPGGGAAQTTFISIGTAYTDDHEGVVRIGAARESTSNKASIVFHTSDSTSTSSEKVRIDSSGGVGIGTNSPYTAAGYGILTLNGSTGGQLRFRTANADSGIVYSTSSGLNVYAFPSQDLNLYAGGVERLKIGNAGKHYFNADGTAGRIYLNTTNDNRSFGENSAGTGSAATYIGNAQIQVSSDVRIKENIQDTQLDALAAVKQISVKDFTWNDPKDTSHNNRNARGTWTGVIAQELVEILPFVVNAPRNEDDLEIDHDSEEIWTLDQSQLCPVLIKAMQQQQAMIETLEAKVAALEAQ